MRTPAVVAAILLGATVAQAQNGPVSQVAPPPPPTSGPTPVIGKKVNWVDAALETMAKKKPDGGGPGSSTVAAQEALNAARGSCIFVPKDEKLVAACDNTTGEGLVRLPKTKPDWEVFAARLQVADRVVNGKPRGMIVLNGTETMAEITAAGLLVPRK
jgi:hypothetical protein